MTRKDYIAIAGAIRHTQEHLRSLPQADAVNPLHMPWAVALTAERIAAVLASDNPRFDRARFLAACGVQS